MAETSSHSKQEQRKQEREALHAQKEEAQAARQQRKNNIWIGIILLILVTFAIGVGWLFTHKPEMYTSGDVHWHALIDITICGEHRDLPTAEESAKLAHGQPYLGSSLMHSHDDNTIHIEGLVRKKEDITLGKFFDSIEMPFGEAQILDYKNNDRCPNGKPGIWQMYVNDKPRDDFRDYVIASTSPAGKQVIKFVFAPLDENT